MQTVSTSFTNMSLGTVRNPVAEAFFAWDKVVDESIEFFTIGSSSIGGTDIIAGGTASDLGDIFRYEYTEESDYLMTAETDRSLNDPFYTIVRAAADVIVDNISDRFNPLGASAIAAYIKQGRPLRVFLGFDYGTAETVNVFNGQVTETPEVDTNNRTVRFHALDVMDLVLGSEVGDTAMLTNTRTDLVIASLLADVGLSPDQYQLDNGVQTIPFVYFQRGEKLETAINKLLQVESGVFYLSEQGVFIFDVDRLRASDPLAISVLTLTDSQIISEENRNIDTIINSVTVNAQPRAAAAAAVVWNLGAAISLAVGESKTFWVNYENPMTSITTPTSGGPNSIYAAGFTSTTTDATANLALDTFQNFAQATKVVIQNTHATLPIYLTQFDIYGVGAAITDDISVTVIDQTSIDEYGTRAFTIDNDFIQTRDQASTLAAALVADRKDPYNSIELEIRGIPQLQIGDVVDRNGTNYEVVRIVNSLTPDRGLLQRLWLRR